MRLNVVGKLAAVATMAAFLFLFTAFGQNYPQQQPPPNYSGAPPQASLAPQQLDDLVAPIALYPDPLVGEIMAAATYPMEIAEAEQWVRDHSSWKPSKMMDEAKKQNWDPSVQGLVAFPPVLTRLSQDIGWTTQLGNAFLAQQTDVMQAVQRMRAQAEARGTLHSTPQETVTTQDQGGQSAIDIEPANPDVWYVPDYNPVYVWGPPVWGAYPALLYPGIGFGWFPGCELGLWFGGWGGWGWGGWGWMPNWYGGGIILNHSFLHRYGFNHFDRGGAGQGTSMWSHNPEHRLGVPYANRAVADRFNGRTIGETGSRFNANGGAQQGVRQGTASQPERFGSPGFEQRSYTNNHSVFGGYHDGATTRTQSDHGFSSMGSSRVSGGGFHGGGGGGGGFHGGGGGGRR